MPTRNSSRWSVVVEAIGALIIVALMLGWAICLFVLECFYSVTNIIKRSTAISRDGSSRLDTPAK
jgi:hypothetical protein